MSEPEAPELSKAERLAIGGAVAPALRRRAGAPRKVTLVDKDGKPTGTTTDIEVAKSLLARSEIEFSVQEGKRPEFVNCERCRRPVRVPARGGIPKRCHAKNKCDTCGRPIKRHHNRDATCNPKMRQCVRCKNQPMTGCRFGRVVVISDAGQNRHGLRQHNCACDCGNSCILVGARLRDGSATSCGCLARELSRKRARARAECLDGRVFGAATVVQEVFGSHTNSRWFRCQCRCGTMFVSRSDRLRKGTASCEECRRSRARDLALQQHANALRIKKMAL